MNNNATATTTKEISFVIASLPSPLCVCFGLASSVAHAQKVANRTH